jgi:hypothetical protein
MPADLGALASPAVAARRTSVRVAARHEAGHCVVALAMGWRVRAVDVTEQADRGGTAHYFSCKSYSGYRPADRQRRLSVLFGGVEAERRVCRASIFSLLTTAGAGDAERMRELLDAAYGPWADAPAGVRRLRDAEEERARRAARDAIRLYWRAVEALTRALARRGKLCGPELFALATRASPALGRQFAKARRQRWRSQGRRLVRG